jgi:hypothetical protein
MNMTKAAIIQSPIWEDLKWLIQQPGFLSEDGSFNFYNSLYRFKIKEDDMHVNYRENPCTRSLVEKVFEQSRLQDLKKD